MCLQKIGFVNNAYEQVWILMSQLKKKKMIISHDKPNTFNFWRDVFWSFSSFYFPSFSFVRFCPCIVIMIIEGWDAVMWKTSPSTNGLLHAMCMYPCRRYTTYTLVLFFSFLFCYIFFIYTVLFYWYIYYYIPLVISIYLLK